MLSRSAWPIGRRTPIVAPAAPSGAGRGPVLGLRLGRRRGAAAAGGGSSATGAAWIRAASGWPAAASSSFSLPVIESLNSRMPVPSCLPRPGSRLGPKMRSTITRTMASSSGPMRASCESVSPPEA